MYAIEYNGQIVHARLGEEFDGDTYDTLIFDVDLNAAEHYFDNCLVPVLDEDNNPIPIDKCICGAYNPSECGCQTTCWDNYNYDEGDY
jgi:hypothetical protein